MLVRMSKKNYVKDIAQSKKESAKKNITLNFRERKLYHLFNPWRWY
jgi:chorismate mutase